MPPVDADCPVLDDVSHPLPEAIDAAAVRARGGRSALGRLEATGSRAAGGTP